MNIKDFIPTDLMELFGFLISALLLAAASGVVVLIWRIALS